MLNYGLVKLLVNRMLNNKARIFLGSFVDSNNSKVTLAKLKFHNIATLCKPISVIIPVILLCLSKTSLLVCFKGTLKKNQMQAVYKIIVVTSILVTLVKEVNEALVFKVNLF